MILSNVIWINKNNSHEQFYECLNHSQQNELNVSSFKRSKKMHLNVGVLRNRSTDSKLSNKFLNQNVFKKIFSDFSDIYSFWWWTEWKYPNATLSRIKKLANMAYLFSKKCCLWRIRLMLQRNFRTNLCSFRYFP